MRYKSKQNKESRRRAAIARKEARDNRTTKEQLSLIRQRPGQSAREVSRITGGGFGT